LVEDESARVQAILPDLQKLFGEVEIAGDRDTAMERVADQAFDLVVLDQRIPSGAGRLDPDVTHGRAVLQHIREVAPDTVVYFLTALPLGDEYTDQLFSENQRCDVFGDRNPIPLVLRFPKASPARFLEAIERLAATARATDQIEISTRGAKVAFTDNEARLLRSFGRVHDGVSIDIEDLNPGLSGARVLKVDVKDSHGDIRISAVAKLGGHEAIEREVNQYEREVVRLPPGSYAPLLPPPLARVLQFRGAFYRLLEGYNRSLFEVLQGSDRDGAACVKALQESEAAWAKKPAVRQLTVGRLAELLIRKSRLEDLRSLLSGIKWDAYEAREISANFCTRHGDLHGENARADSRLNVMMLDYGSVEPLPAAIDAVTLELSPLFHPRGNRNLINWQPNDGPIDWFDREAFGKLLRIPSFMHAAREWAHSAAFGDREVLACAYVYVLRQLQYRTTDQNLARGMLSGIVARGLAT
jgi:hypothetical protein